jgi:hypothetical protein
VQLPIGKQDVKDAWLLGPFNQTAKRPFSLLSRRFRFQGRPGDGNKPVRGPLEAIRNPLI